MLYQNDHGLLLDCKVSYPRRWWLSWELQIQLQLFSSPIWMCCRGSSTSAALLPICCAVTCNFEAINVTFRLYVHNSGSCFLSLRQRFSSHETCWLWSRNSLHLNCVQNSNSLRVRCLKSGLFTVWDGWNFTTCMTVCKHSVYYVRTRFCVLLSRKNRDWRCLSSRCGEYFNMKKEVIWE
jgi:hypothetical protein